MNRQILNLAIPNIISNISVPLISAVDTALMGHINSSNLSALGIGAMIFVFLYGSFSFLRVGTTGITAQAYGENNKPLIANTLSRALLIGAIISIILILMQKQIYYIGVYLMNVDVNYLKKVKIYFDIRILTAPAVMIQYAIMGWFLGIQNAKIPLILTIIINILNLILSYYFVMHLNMQIKGAAYGTLISQYIGVLVGILIILKYKDTIKLISWKTTLQKSKLLKFFKINKDIFIRTTLLTFVLAFFYSQAAKHSQQTLSIMIILLQFLIWMSFALDGFANAAESLVGKYYGAKDWTKYNKAIRYSFYWSFSFAILFSIVYYFFDEKILSIYTNQTTLIQNSMPYMWLVALLPILSFTAFVWDGVFIGMTASKAMRNSILLSTILFLILFYSSKEINYTWALWGSFVLFFLFRGIIQSWMFYKHGKNLT